jgi:hypothetical protein
MPCTPCVGVEDRNIAPVRVDVFQGIVATVNVFVQRVCGIENSFISQVDSVGRHPPAKAGSVVPCPEVVKGRFGIAFFAGELVHRTRLYTSSRAWGISAS